MYLSKVNPLSHILKIIFKTHIFCLSTLFGSRYQGEGGSMRMSGLCEELSGFGGVMGIG